MCLYMNHVHAVFAWESLRHGLQKIVSCHVHLRNQTGSDFCWCNMSSSLLSCLASLREWKLSKLQGKPLEKPNPWGRSVVKFAHRLREEGFHQRSEQWEKHTKKMVLELAHIIRN